MGMTNDMAKAEQKIVAVLARMLVVAPESIKTDSRYQKLFNMDPDSVHAFAVQVEQALGVIVGDSVLDAHPTVADLAAYCTAHKADTNGGRRYVVVCRMPGGGVRSSPGASPTVPFPNSPMSRISIVISCSRRM